MAKRIIIGRFPGADELARPSLEACRYIYNVSAVQQNGIKQALRRACESLFILVQMSVRQL